MRVASLNAISDTSLTVGVWIDAGSRYETRESNGSAHYATETCPHVWVWEVRAAVGLTRLVPRANVVQNVDMDKFPLHTHFLEHMTFKGTQKRSRVGLETEVENMGGHLNAYTSREQTVYYAKVFPQDIEHGLDILSDILGKSLITARSVEDERSVITREMEEVEKSVEEVIFDRLHLAAFRDHMLGATILGPVENIHHLEPKHLRNYVETNYTTDRMVVVAVGAVDHDQLLGAVERYFGGFRTDPAGYTPYTRPRWMALAPPAADVAQQEEDNEAPYYEKYAGMKVTDAIPMMEDAEIAQFQQDRFALLQKADPNFQPAFCEQYSAFNTCYRDTGLFGVHAACHPDAVRPVVEELMFGINRLADGITEAELERAKRELRTILFASQDNTTNLAEEIGRHLLVYGRRIPPAEMDQRLSAITVDEINRVATEYLRGREIAVTALGPIDNMPKLEEIKQMNNMAKA
eukprot:g1608.t1